MRTLIVDDESPSRELLRSMLLTYCPQITHIEEAANLKEALQQIEALSPHIVFLDIEMPDGKGFDILKRTNSQQFMTVFVTAYGKYAIQAIKEGAMDYLLKPLSAEELKATVARAHVSLLKKGVNSVLDGRELDRHISINSSKGFKFISLREIVRLEADNTYTFFYLADGSRVLVTKSITEAGEPLLKSKWFFRTHRSHIINFLYFKEYLKEDGDYVLMQNGEKISLSRLRVEEFLQRVQQFSTFV